MEILYLALLFEWGYRGYQVVLGAGYDPGYSQTGQKCRWLHDRQAEEYVTAMEINLSKHLVISQGNSWIAEGLAVSSKSLSMKE